MWAYLVYDINKVLGVVAREVFNHLNLVVVREDGRDQRDAFIRGEGVTNQSFPGWAPTGDSRMAKLINA